MLNRVITECDCIVHGVLPDLHVPCFPKTPKRDSKDLSLDRGKSAEKIEALFLKGISSLRSHTIATPKSARSQQETLLGHTTNKCQLDSSTGSHWAHTPEQATPLVCSCVLFWRQLRQACQRKSLTLRGTLSFQSRIYSPSLCKWEVSSREFIII